MKIIILFTTQQYRGLKRDIDRLLPGRLCQVFNNLPKDYFGWPFQNCLQDLLFPLVDKQCNERYQTPTHNSWEGHTTDPQPFPFLFLLKRYLIINSESIFSISLNGSLLFWYVKDDMNTLIASTAFLLHLLSFKFWAIVKCCFSIYVCI